MRRWATLLLLPLVLASACSRKRVQTAPPAAPLPLLSNMREFAIPWPDAYPSDIAVDSTGRVWFTDRLTHVIGMFDPATEQFHSIKPPTPRSTPYGLIVAPDGTLWYAASGAGRIGRVDPATQQLTEFVLPNVTGGPHLLAWRNDEIWFSIRETQGYGRLDPRTGAATVYRLPGNRPYSVAVVANAVWMNSYGSSRLLEIDPQTGAARVHELRNAPIAPALPTTDSVPPPRLQRATVGEVRRIAADAAGGIWFTDFSFGRVLRYDPVARNVRMFESLERRSEPYGITISARGHVWYGEKGTNRIVALDPVADERIRVTVPTPRAVVRHIAVDAKRGRVWLPLSEVGKIGLIELR